MIRTATGDFEIAFRRMAWEEDARDFFAWAKAEGVSAVDLRRDIREVGQWALDEGLAIGSADLLEWDGLGAIDADDRAKAADQNAAYIRDAAKLGIHRFMIVTYAEAHREDAERIAAFADGFRRLHPVLEETGSKIVIEGVPRRDIVCWRPSSYRRLFAEGAGEHVGINFDPSHLVRARIDPLRFLDEFGAHVFHAHAKDTERLPDAEYEWGSEAADDNPVTRYTGRTWRYVLPGQGEGSWTALLAKLKEVGFEGRIGIEAEDDRLEGVAAIRQATVEACAFLKAA